ncbi:MAG TPA: LamG domain-containing protein [Polyangia bacterium]|nr:LamG domain-containing protein [Polyangia bacterium]
MASATLLLACVAGCGPAPITAVSVPRSRLLEGLLGHWSFDEGSGTTVADSSGNHYDGQLSGGTWVTDGGRFQGGLRLAPGDTVTIPGFPQATADWTVSVWIKMSKDDVAAFTSARAVVLSAERPSMGGWEIEFDPRPGFKWLEASYYVTTPASDYVVLDCKCIETDRWLHFTAVFDTTHLQISLYHDDVLVDHADLPQPIVPDGAPDLTVGHWISASDRPISGIIDDYAIWTRALNADEVAAINAEAVPDSP